MKSKAKKKPIVYIPAFHEQIVALGGEGTRIIDWLKSEGIRAQNWYSPYVGHCLIAIEKGKLRQAKKVLKNYSHWWAK
jgi:hypothetical protein